MPRVIDENFDLAHLFGRGLSIDSGRVASPEKWRWPLTGLQPPVLPRCLSQMRNERDVETLVGKPGRQRPAESFSGANDCAYWL